MNVQLAHLSADAKCKNVAKTIRCIDLQTSRDCQSQLRAHTHTFNLL